MKRNFHTLSIACVLLVTCSCGLGHKSSPSDVVLEAYKAANEGKYAEVEKYLSFDTVDAIKAATEAFGSWVGGMKGTWDKATRNRTIEKIKILNEEIRGDKAKVRYRIHFKDGSAKDDDVNLVKEGGQWKITV
jgi:hypothetical protein